MMTERQRRERQIDVAGGLLIVTSIAALFYVWAVILFH